MYNDMLVYYVIFVQSVYVDRVPWVIMRTQSLRHLHELQGEAAAEASRMTSTVVSQSD